jgi:hypothetical protein
LNLQPVNVNLGGLEFAREPLFPEGRGAGV